MADGGKKKQRRTITPGGRVVPAPVGGRENLPTDIVGVPLVRGVTTKSGRVVPPARGTPQPGQRSVPPFSILARRYTPVGVSAYRPPPRPQSSRRPRPKPKG